MRQKTLRRAIFNGSAKVFCLASPLLFASACGPVSEPPESPAANSAPLAPAPAATVEQVLEEYRSSPEWKQSRDAFRSIMRKHLHGHSSDWTDAELDEDFEMFLTLSQDEFELFLETHSCQHAKTGEAARYYSVHATHERHDAYANIPAAHPPAGTGSKHVRAAFSANLLMERFDVDHATTLPKRATMEGSPFRSWEAIEEAMTNREQFDKFFKFQNSSQADSVFAATNALDWNDKVVGDVFVAPELHGGKYFSPALFATYVFRPDKDSKHSIYIVVAATGRGAPAHPYIGLVDHTPENPDSTYQSTMQTVFDFLSTKKNLLRYRLRVDEEAPLVVNLFMSTAYPTHPDHPYITIESEYGPIADDKKLEKFLKSPSTKVMQMIKKASLLKDLFHLYYPGETEAELWLDLEAIKKDTGFVAKLEAAGLTAASDVFGRHLWTESPTIESAPESEHSTADSGEQKASGMQPHARQQRICP